MPGEWYALGRQVKVEVHTANSRPGSGTVGPHDVSGVVAADGEGALHPPGHQAIASPPFVALDGEGTHAHGSRSMILN